MFYNYCDMKKEKKKNPYLEQLEEKYNEQANARKEKIRQEPSKWKRFWKWVWFWISFPFIWIFYNIRDWRTAIIFIIVFLLVSSEVWVPYLIGFICWSNEALRISMFSIGSACWAFWLGPGTPFMIIVIGITIGVKAAFDKIRQGIKKRKEDKENDEIL